MVVKRKWKVVSGSMAAGAILAPATAMARDGLPALNDVVPYVSDSPTTEDATFYQNLTQGLPVTFNFESELSAADSIADDTSAPTVASVASEASEPTVASAASDAATVASAGSGQSVPSEASTQSEASQPSAPSAPDSEQSADDSF